ncbi:MAG: DUF167 domain-containing protein [Chloroflexi bacterium]|nr:DUF167 domain-containing protein [Chloroflexota bacterium]MCL5026948.1 DUF167 domain-containing protein [Chloroflexota bacterium]
MSAARIQVRLQPRAGENRIVGFEGDVLKARVTAPPEGGRANEALVTLLAEAMGVAKGRVRIVRGQTARLKQIEIEGLEQAEARDRLVHPHSG